MNVEQRPQNAAAYIPGEDDAPPGPADDAGRGVFVLAIAVAALLVFAVIVWNAFQDGRRDGGAGRLPQIAAAPGDAKTRPDGVPDAATVIGEPEVAARIEALYEDDAMDMPPVVETDVAAETRVVSDGLPQNLLPGETRETAPEARPEPTMQQWASIPSPSASARMPATPPASAPAAAAPVQESVPAPGADGRFAPGGAFVVQIGSVRSEADALRVWSGASGRAPALFGGAERDIERADLGERGVYYRVRVAAFADRETANAFCADFKAEGGDCLVARR